MTYHELNLFCLKTLGEKKYHQYWQDILEIIGYLTNEKITNNELFVFRDEEIKINLNKFKKILFEVVAGKPLVRYTKKLHWRKLDLIISKNVFIPRKETELLVDVAVNVLTKINKNKRNIIYDVCSGSGCIAISLKKIFKNFKVYASDISISAINNIKINAQLNNVKINFLKANLLDYAIKDKIKIYMLTCNPPYVSLKEKLDVSVIKNDPFKALFAKDNGYYFYLQIAKQIQQCVIFPKYIIFEIGINQEKKIIKLFSNLGYCCKIYKDFNKINRVLKFIKK